MAEVHTYCHGCSAELEAHPYHRPAVRWNVLRFNPLMGADVVREVAYCGECATKVCAHCHAYLGMEPSVYWDDEHGEQFCDVQCANAHVEAYQP